jgi:hypothetical protein
MASSKLPKRPVPVSCSRTYHGDAMVIVLTMPVVTVSEANSHTHWRVRAKRAKGQRGTTRALLAAHAGKPPVPPFAVHIVRIAPRGLDSDNLAGSAKHVRDGLADWADFDDKDERVAWTYGQESDPTPRTYGTRIEIRKERA